MNPQSPSTHPRGRGRLAGVRAGRAPTPTTTAAACSWRPRRLFWRLDKPPTHLDGPAEEQFSWEIERFCTLALQANPTVLEVLWSPLVEQITADGEQLLAARRAFLSGAGRRDLRQLRPRPAQPGRAPRAGAHRRDQPQAGHAHDPAADGRARTCCAPARCWSTCAAAGPAARGQARRGALGRGRRLGRGRCSPTWPRRPPKHRAARPARPGRVDELLCAYAERNLP